MQNIVKAALCLHDGNHAGATEALQALECDTPDTVVQIAFASLSSDAHSSAALYQHFVALKLLIFAVIRTNKSRREFSEAVVGFLMTYVSRLEANFETSSWTPIASEVGTCIALSLKLGCIDDHYGIAESAVSHAVRTLAEMSQAVSSPARMFLNRVICQSAVEEFGLYDAASRNRGLPMRVHRRCREMFAAEAALPLILQGVVSSITDSTKESRHSADAALSLLISCFAWPSHLFFEEDSSMEESCSQFAVDHVLWNYILAGAMVMPSGNSLSIYVLLREWYGSSCIRGIAISHQKVVELIQLICSFKGSKWGEAQTKGFLDSSLSLCLDVFEHMSKCAGEDDYHIFPLLANGILRLVTNYIEFFFTPDAQPLLTRLTALTQFLIHIDASTGDDDNVMSCVDEMLSVWYHLTSYIDRNHFATADSSYSQQWTFVADSCCEIFTTYLQCKVTPTAVELEDNHFSETFTNSHLHLIAHVGRMCLSRTTELLIETIGDLHVTLLRSLSEGSIPPSVYESLWTVLKIVGFLIADPSDGEQPYIPRCFLEAGLASDTQLIRLMEKVAVLCTALENPLVSSSAVWAALTEVLRNYIKTYVEAEETCPVYISACNGGADVVGLTLQVSVYVLRVFPFESDATSAVCDALDTVGEKSTAVRHFCAAHECFGVLHSYAELVDTYRFCGHTRGRIIGFLLTCCTNPANLPAALGTFALTTSPSDDINRILEFLSSLAGLFESLHTPQVIRGVFPYLLQTGQHLIQVSVVKFFEREITLESVHFVRSMFVTCSPLLEDDGVRALLFLVVTELQYATASLESSSTWATDKSGTDKVEFVIALSKLLCSISQWKTLDCYLPDEETTTVAAVSVQTAGVLLRSLDESTLSVPSLEDSIFTCIEVCAESFSADFVYSKCSDAFLSATLYALNSDRITVQRAGISITTCVASFLERSQASEQYASACMDLFKVVLHAFACGKIFFNNVRQVSRAFLTLARGVPEKSISDIFSLVSTEVPKCDNFLRFLFSALGSAIQRSSTSDAQFEDSVQDALSTIRGISII